MDPFAPRLQVTLLGDSLTERSTEPWGWGTRLSHWYTRKADVIVRGYSGYNVRALRIMLQKHGGLPRSASIGQKSLVVLWIGANDAASEVACPEQHVPISEYRSGVETMLKQFMDEDRIVLLMTPPVVDIDAWNADCTFNGRPLNSRSNYVTRQYAAACADVAQGFENVHIIDLHSRMVKYDEWRALLSDGLHMSELGNEFVFNAICDQISASLPDLLPSNLPFDAPTWFHVLKGQPNADMDEAWRIADPLFKPVQRRS